MDKVILGNHLKDLRENFSLTQREIAKYLNISRSTYAYYETGKIEPSLGSIIALSKLYGISTDSILLCHRVSLNIKLNKSLL